MSQSADVKKVLVVFSPRSLEEEIVTRTDWWGGGGQSDPPSTFDTIHPIGMKFGTYNKLHLQFQFSETTWCLIGFHSNDSQIKTSQEIAILDFYIFRFSSDCTSK